MTHANILRNDIMTASIKKITLNSSKNQCVSSRG